MNRKRTQIPELRNIDFRHLENMFSVKKGSDGRFYYDLTDTIFINPDTMSPLLFEEHVLVNGDTLYSLSQKYYETRNLWWLIGITNNINDPFELDNMTGQTINIPINSIVGEILNTISQ